MPSVLRDDGRGKCQAIISLCEADAPLCPLFTTAEREGRHLHKKKQTSRKYPQESKPPSFWLPEKGTVTVLYYHSLTDKITVRTDT